MQNDKLGRLIWTDALRRNFDAHGRIISEHFPEGYDIENRYDPAGRRIKCAILKADCAIEYEYNATDLTRVTRKNSQGEELYSHHYLAYDLSGNLFKESSISQQEIDYRTDPLSRKINISSLPFTQKIVQFDAVGNILHMQIGTDQNYTYDGLYQLTSETGPFAHSYLFDGLNNRLKKDQEAYQINALQQVVSHLEYDRNGNATQNGDAKYTWDALDRLIRVEMSSCVQTFEYDVLHRCVKRMKFQGNMKPEVHYFLYDGNKEIGALDEWLSPVELRILGHAPHAEIGASIGIELDGLIYEPIHDLQGNLAVLTSLDRISTTLYRYSAFGEEQIIGPIICPWRFSSKRSDQESGLVYFGRRVYLPALGRWLTPDPSGFKDGMNLYAFVHNAPLTHHDEYGLITYVHGQGWQNCPWGSPFSYSSSNLRPSNQPPEQWNRSRVDTRLIPSMDLYYKYTPHYYINGIFNTPSDSRIGAGALRRSLGGFANVIPIYSESFGTFGDPLSVYRSKYNQNYTSFAVRRINREVRSSALYMDALNDPRKIFVTAFSRGVADTYHAVKTCSPEHKNRLIITTCGPTMILPRNLGFSVTNLVSSGDWCSKFCNWGFRRNFNKYDGFAKVVMLPQRDGFSGFIRDHFFLSNTYQEGIKIFTAEKYEKYGGPR
jgi:RHS repeat-associated protein